MRKFLNSKFFGLALLVSLIACTKNHASAMKKGDALNQSHTDVATSSSSFLEASRSCYGASEFKAKPENIDLNLERPSRPTCTHATHCFSRPSISLTPNATVERTTQPTVVANVWLDVAEFSDDSDDCDYSSYPYSGIFTMHPLEIASRLQRPSTPHQFNK